MRVLKRHLHYALINCFHCHMRLAKSLHLFCLTANTFRNTREAVYVKYIRKDLLHFFSSNIASSWKRSKPGPSDQSSILMLEGGRCQQQGTLPTSIM